MNTQLFGSCSCVQTLRWIFLLTLLVLQLLTSHSLSFSYASFKWIHSHLAYVLMCKHWVFLMLHLAILTVQWWEVWTCHHYDSLPTHMPFLHSTLWSVVHLHCMHYWTFLLQTCTHHVPQPLFLGEGIQRHSCFRRVFCSLFLSEVTKFSQCYLLLLLLAVFFVLPPTTPTSIYRCTWPK